VVIVLSLAVMIIEDSRGNSVRAASLPVEI
jgi:hypothetical protein